MHAAGVRELGGPVELLELPGPRALRLDEVLLDVRACGVGNWDEFVRTGGWDTGARPPMALGVEAAGIVAAAGSEVPGLSPGDAVATHSVPFRDQGAWAEAFIAPAGHVARLPADVPFGAAAALPVPALTADQAIDGTLNVRPGQTVLVNSASGITGGMLVQLAVHRGATVIATAGPGAVGRVRALGAAHFLDYHQPDWPARVRSLTSGGADAAVNAAPAGAGDAMRAVREGGSLATITHDPPQPERGITVHQVEVEPDGARLTPARRAGGAGRADLLGRRCAAAGAGRGGPGAGQARHQRYGRGAAAAPTAR
jgi:NADPH:quinone reductase-like Zn-dependent oxidoreductase